MRLKTRSNFLSYKEKRYDEITKSWYNLQKKWKKEGKLIWVKIKF